MTKEEVENAQKLIKALRMFKSSLDATNYGVRISIPEDWVNQAKEFSKKVGIDENEAIAILTSLYMGSNKKYSKIERWIFMEAVVFTFKG